MVQPASSGQNLVYNIPSGWRASLCLHVLRSREPPPRKQTVALSELSHTLLLNSEPCTVLCLARPSPDSWRREPLAAVVTASSIAPGDPFPLVKNGSRILKPGGIHFLEVRRWQPAHTDTESSLLYLTSQYFLKMELVSTFKKISHFKNPGSYECLSIPSSFPTWWSAVHHAPHLSCLTLGWLTSFILTTRSL